MSLKVLLVQMQAQSVRALNQFLKQLDAKVDMAFDLGEAATRLAAQEYDLMMLDMGFSSADWEDFLAIARSEYPGMKVILTAATLDRDREVHAQEMGVSTVLRQPFTPYWFRRALNAVGLGPLEDSPPSSFTPLYRTPQVGVPLGLKLTLPFLLIMLLIAAGSAVIAGSYFNRQAQAGFDSQLGSTARLASGWMVAQENQLNQSLRLLANAHGVPELIQAGDSEGLRQVALPIAANSDEETVEIINRDGVGLLSLHKTPENQPGLYEAQRGDSYFQNIDFVQQALQSGGDTRTAGMVDTPWGSDFYVCSPIVDQNGSVVGAVLIGRSPRRFAQQLQAETQTNVTFYDASGKPLASTLFSDSESYPLEQTAVQQAAATSQGQSPTRSLQVNGAAYSEILSPWSLNGSANLGMFGLALQRNPLINLKNLNLTEILSFMAAAFLIVILIGLLLANSTTSRVRQLTKATSEIASGNIHTPIDTEGSDEFATLAKSFKQMLAGLQEGALTRDVLGHSVTPELREELRKSMALQNLRLEGQQMTIAVLKTNLFDFQHLLDQADALKAFEWLNEYYGLLAPIIHAHGGIIQRLEASSVTAYFGLLPLSDSIGASVSAAYDAAQEMLTALKAFNQAQAEAGEPLMNTGISIHSGQVLAGALGYDEKLDYVIMGEGVKGAVALADMTPLLGQESSAYLSQAAAKAIHQKEGEYPLEQIAIRDRKNPTSEIYVYRLLPRQAAEELEVQV